MRKKNSFRLDELDVLTRNDFVAFSQKCFQILNPNTRYLHNGHIEVIASALEECRRGQLRRLAINVPPRSLKSHLTSICFVVWLLGHNPSASIICVSYAQDLADTLATACRTIMLSEWYQRVFPHTRLASRRQAIHDLVTTSKGGRFATSLGGVMTGRGADFVLIDDPLKPEEALSSVQRQNVNDWYDHTLVSRLNNKLTGCIIIIMQRLHEDDLVGHVTQQGGWRLLKFPAIAEEEENHIIETPYGHKTFHRNVGEALHPEREPLYVLAQLRESMGEYNFYGQYQQAPAPMDGGLVKLGWFKSYKPEELPAKPSQIIQSWDTANKPGELCDYSVCTTWEVHGKKLYLVDVFRQRLDYPSLKRAVLERRARYKPQVILIEDKASGTQLIQELLNESIYEVKRYESRMDKIMRLHSVTSTIENGFVHLPEKADWLPAYLHELPVFPNGKFDDQVDSTSQALDWFKSSTAQFGVLEWFNRELQQLANPQRTLESLIGTRCQKCEIGNLSRSHGRVLRCQHCGEQTSLESVEIYRGPTRGEILGNNPWLGRR